MSTTVAELPAAVESPAKKRNLESTREPLTTVPNGQNMTQASTDTQSTQFNPILRVELMNQDAQMPVRGSEKSAGYDLFSAVDVTIPKRGKQLVSTGIKIMLPENCYGRIAPRSGLAVKHALDVGAGVVDEDYRGEIKVVMFNLSDEDFLVTKGMRIAQLVCERIWYPSIEKVDSVDETKRGEGGFGSTGTK